VSASPPPASQTPPAAGDPSMEDILASIRRILSEDEAEPADGQAIVEDRTIMGNRARVDSEAMADGQSVAEGEEHDDVLDLDASMIVEEPEGWTPPPAPTTAVVASPPAAEAWDAELAVVEDPAAHPPASGGFEPLVAPAAAAAAASSVGALLRSVVAGREQVAVHRGGPTIEDMVREEIRPLLKQWLDVNLPPLVERLVRSEMERIVGRVS
jgi:cell pole-organizing protein PopZ